MSHESCRGEWSVELRVLMTLYYGGKYLHGIEEKCWEERLLGSECRRDVFHSAFAFINRIGLVNKSVFVAGEGKNECNNNALIMRECEGGVDFCGESTSSNIISLAEVSNSWQVEKQQDLAKVTDYLLKQKWCVGLALTGSQTFADKRGDIDFLIITKKDSLWWGRACTLIWAMAQGKKRKRDQKEDWGWCFNLWLSEDSLVLPNNKKTIMSAYELLQAKWLIDRSNIELKLVLGNSFLQDMLGNYYKKMEYCASILHLSTAEIMRYKCNNSYIVNDKYGKKADQWFFIYAIKVVELCNNVRERAFYAIQLIYMLRGRKGAEIVSLRQAFFHPMIRKDSNMNVLADHYQRENYHRYWWKDADTMPLFLSRIVTQVRKDFSRLVLVTGVFDLLHPAHLDFLQKAAAEGDILVVGIESDVRVGQLKGDSRPVQNQLERFLQLSKISEVRAVFVLPDNFGEIGTREKILKAISPDILAVSASSQNLVAKQLLMEKIGGKLIIVKKHDHRYSTSKMVGNQ